MLKYYRLSNVKCIADENNENILLKYQKKHCVVTDGVCRFISTGINYLEAIDNQKCVAMFMHTNITFNFK